MSERSADEWISQLELIEHPEGGYYKQTFQSSIQIGNQNASSNIYFLLKQGQLSHLHRLKQDETWNFYYGDSLTVVVMDSKGTVKKELLGNPIFHPGASFQLIVEAGNWFGACCNTILKRNHEPQFGYSLVGCTVAPAFNFHDFELGKRNELIQEFPENEEVLSLITFE